MAEILVVDDEQAFRDPLSWQLWREGHSVQTAREGAQAVALVRAHEFDLILTDLRMPVMDGLEFLRSVISKIESVTPCIVLVDYSDVSRAIRAIQVGAYDYIRKPWEREEMRLAVDRALTRRADRKFRRDYQLDVERKVQDAVAELKASYAGTIAALMEVIECKDKSIADHCARVRDLCSRLGREMRLGADSILDLERGAMLHDLGKC